MRVLSNTRQVQSPLSCCSQNGLNGLIPVWITRALLQNIYAGFRRRVTYRTGLSRDAAAAHTDDVQEIQNRVRGGEIGLRGFENGNGCCRWAIQGNNCFTCVTSTSAGSKKGSANDIGPGLVWWNAANQTSPVLSLVTCYISQPARDIQAAQPSICRT